MMSLSMFWDMEGCCQFADLSSRSVVWQLCPSSYRELIFYLYLFELGLGSSSMEIYLPVERLSLAREVSLKDLFFLITTIINTKR